MYKRGGIAPAPPPPLRTLELQPAPQEQAHKDKHQHHHHHADDGHQPAPHEQEHDEPHHQQGHHAHQPTTDAPDVRELLLLKLQKIEQEMQRGREHQARADLYDHQLRIQQREKHQAFLMNHTAIDLGNSLTHSQEKKILPATPKKKLDSELTLQKDYKIRQALPLFKNVFVY